MASCFTPQSMPVLHSLVGDWLVRQQSENIEQIAHICQQARQNAAWLKAASDAAELHLHYWEKQLEASEAAREIERFTKAANRFPHLEIYPDPGLGEISICVLEAVTKLDNLVKDAASTAAVITEEAKNLEKDIVSLKKSCKAHPEMLDAFGLRETIEIHQSKVKETIGQTGVLDTILEITQTLQRSANGNAHEYHLKSKSSPGDASRLLKIFWFQGSLILLEEGLIRSQLHSILSNIRLMKANGRCIAQMQKCFVTTTNELAAL